MPAARNGLSPSGPSGGKTRPGRHPVKQARYDASAWFRASDGLLWVTRLHHPRSMAARSMGSDPFHGGKRSPKGHPMPIWQETERIDAGGRVPQPPGDASPVDGHLCAQHVRMRRNRPPIGSAIGDDDPGTDSEGLPPDPSPDLAGEPTPLAHGASTISVLSSITRSMRRPGCQARISMIPRSQ